MSIQYQAVTDLAIAFGRIPAETRAVLRPKIVAAGNIIANEARANASWSSRIPGAISVSANISTRGGSVVRVSSAKAPHARPYEGAGGNSTFRHPVYGNRQVWVSQATRPFLLPALRSESPKAVEGIRLAVRSVLDRLI